MNRGVLERSRAITELDRLRVWNDPATRRRLGWYREVAANRRPAKLRIAVTIPLEVALDAGEADPLARARTPDPPSSSNPSLLEFCSELAFRMLEHCNFCRWDCQVDRTHETKLGACKLGAGARVSTWFHHTGEELVYPGMHGSVHDARCHAGIERLLPSRHRGTTDRQALGLGSLSPAPAY